MGRKKYIEKGKIVIKENRHFQKRFEEIEGLTLLRIKEKIKKLK